jgi:hypothetical protein
VSGRIPLGLRLRFLWWWLRYGEERAKAMVWRAGYEHGYRQSYDKGFTERSGIRWEDDDERE